MLYDDDMIGHVEEPFSTFGERWAYNDYEYPKVSVIIPTFDSASKVSYTIESVLSQRYPDFEILVVDAKSSDRTVEIVKGFRDEKIRLFIVSEANLPQMINHGITTASGFYINVLIPGYFYLHDRVLHTIMSFALDHSKPCLAYGGSIMREGREDPEVLFHPFSLSILHKGRIPTRLSSMWFRTDRLRMHGKFNRVYSQRIGFNFLCHIVQCPELKVAALPYVLSDDVFGGKSLRKPWRHFVETCKIIFRDFGWIAMWRWFFCYQDDLRIIIVRILRKIKLAFVGR